MTREEMVAFLRRRGMTGGREWPSDAKIAAQLQADGETIERLKSEAKSVDTNVSLWMIERGYATGHSDTIGDMLGELEAQAKERGKRL